MNESEILAKVRPIGFEILKYKYSFEGFKDSQMFIFHHPGDLGTRKRTGTSCKIETISCLTLLNISSMVLDFHLKFVPDIHFPVQDTDTKFQTVSQKNQDVTSD